MVKDNVIKLVATIVGQKEVNESNIESKYSLLEEALNNVLQTLTPREERVIRLRFGLDDGLTKSLDEVAADFGITSELIRQTEVNVLLKMHHPSRMMKLLVALNDK